MQDKQKVTLYLPSDLHRQLKIRAAVESEAMSTLAERAICFYLAHPEAVEHVGEVQGQTHRIYDCPECSSSLVLREGEMVALGQQPSVLQGDSLSMESVPGVVTAPGSGEEELVPC